MVHGLSLTSKTTYVGQFYVGKTEGGRRSGRASQIDFGFPLLNRKEKVVSAPGTQGTPRGMFLGFRSGVQLCCGIPKP